MQTRVLLLGNPDARPEGLERALVRSGFGLSESDYLPGSPGDSGSPDLAILALAPSSAPAEDQLAPLLREGWGALPTIVLAPAGGSDLASRALALGAVDAMVAPINLNELCARVVARLRAARDGFRATASTNSQAQLFSVYKEVVLAARPEEMLQILVRSLGKSLEANHCACIFTVEARRGRMVAVGERPEIQNLEVDLGDYPEVRHTAATGRTTFIPDAARHPLFSDGRGGRLPAAAPFEPTSAVAVPVTFQGKSLGCLVVRTAAPRPSLTVDDVAFVEALVAATCRLMEHEDRRATVYRRQASAGVIDPLTGCGGLDALDRRIRDEMERSDRYGRSFSVMLVDVDGLRFINQARGVAAGDRVLSELGGLLQRELRAPDFVARHGGDEFAIVMPETPDAGAQLTLDRLRRAIAEHTFGELLGRDVAVSGGWIGYPNPAILSPEDLFAQAEAALAAAKRRHPERVA
ncbi:MAG: diguanylate cyclase [Gemmatimonadales bacterium]